MADDKDTPEYRDGQHSALVIAVAIALSRNPRGDSDSTSQADRLEDLRASTRSMLLQSMPHGATPKQIALMTAGFDSCFGDITKVVRAITGAPDA